MIITLTTDFSAVYPAVMKGVILSIDADATLVDVSHSVGPGDVSGGAFILASPLKTIRREAFI